MMLPNFDENGFLPEGVWDCSVAEFASRFAVFRRSDRRLKLFSQLEVFLEEILKTDWIQEVIIDGSFVTNKDEPNDIDLILLTSKEETEITVPNKGRAALIIFIATLIFAMISIKN